MSNEHRKVLKRAVQKSAEAILALREQGEGLNMTSFWGISAKVTTRFGLDGKWVGVNRGNSYFFLSVDPGNWHLCSDLPPDLYQTERGPVFVTRFTAEPGKTYYLRVHVTSSPVCVSKCDGLRTVLELETIDEDKGQLLVGSSRFSTSHAEDW